MKNELGIEVKCKSCQHRIGCWRYNYKYEKLEPCDNFYPDDEAMVNRIKELQEQMFTEQEASTVLVYMKQANLIIKNEKAHIPNIESIFSKLEKMKGE